MLLCSWSEKKQRIYFPWQSNQPWASNHAWASPSPWAPNQCRSSLALVSEQNKFSRLNLNHCTSRLRQSDTKEQGVVIFSPPSDAFVSVISKYNRSERGPCELNIDDLAEARMHLQILLSSVSSQVAAPAVYSAISMDRSIETT